MKRDLENEGVFGEIPDVVVRSSTLSFSKFLNTAKGLAKDELIDEYTRICQKFVDVLWEMPSIPKLIPKEIVQPLSAETWLSARSLQACAKQASGIVRGARTKLNRMKWAAEKLEAENKLKASGKLRAKIEKTTISKPELKSVCPELDSRFVKLDFSPGTTEFDLWVTISSIGGGKKIVIPLKKSSHLNRLMDKGIVRTGIRLGRNSITFMVMQEPPAPPSCGGHIGIDIGQTHAFSCSNGVQSSQDIHGHDLVTISEKMTRKKRGSKAFERARRHRSNHIGWVLNQLGLDKVRFVSLENIKHLRTGRRISRRLSSWTSTELLSAVKGRCETLGVQVRHVNPAYTSQRCSDCGWVQKSNRKGTSFKCRKCGFTLDADLNGSRNIALPLPGLTRKQRRRGINRTGFYWLLDGRELIVPAAQEPSSTE